MLQDLVNAGEGKRIEEAGRCMPKKIHLMSACSGTGMFELVTRAILASMKVEASIQHFDCGENAFLDTVNLDWKARLVVLPEYQGLGLGPSVSETVGAMLTGSGYRLLANTSHPPLRWVSEFMNTPVCGMVTEPETGYDNTAVSILDIVRKMDSSTSRSLGCRKRHHGVASSLAGNTIGDKGKTAEGETAVQCFRS
eukprot:s728_g37.t1